MLGDTIVAQASAVGSSERAVVRISGPRAHAVAATVFAPELPRARGVVEGHVRVRGRDVDAFALVLIGPHSFTGEDTVELHVPGSSLLVRCLLDELVRDGAARGVRLALPGEFTARAVQNGRLDGASAEGLLMLLHATDRRAAEHAAAWLAGDATRVVQRLRSRLQDGLALLEVGLDFSDGDTGEVPASLWREGLAPLPGELAALCAGLPAAVRGGEVLLLGRANAGKSSLANALAGRALALVAASPGTTRDLLRIELRDGGVLWDAPGDLATPAAVDVAALELRDRLGGLAHGCVVVLDRTAPTVPQSAFATSLPWLAVVWTKCDDGVLPPVPEALRARIADENLPVFATSAHTGFGLAELRAWLAHTAQVGVVDAGGPLRLALTTAAAALARVVGETGAAPELAAVDLRAALAALDGIAEGHCQEQILDRIYRRFCLGK